MTIENKETVSRVATAKNRLKLHLMPPMGWMNDPNGLCYFKGLYHVFFQYSKDDPEGKTLKCWGHYTSKNLLQWQYHGITFCPDRKEDKDGVYSGSAFVEDGLLEVFYTGNVKESGEHDYIYSGRGANVIYAKSEDGIHFSEKEVLLTNQDYPDTYTCHIRDPKVWKENGKYYMVLGGRKGKKDAGEEQGAVLLYESADKKEWHYVKELCNRNPFGYMWECPDYFSLSNQHILSCCPQGIAKQKDQYQNGDLSGYFLISGMTDVLDTVPEENWKKSAFIEWDRGFDFYAPQTFLDNEGRRILIGWVGLPQPEYTNQTTIAEGWQHCLTIPRVLTLGETKDRNGEPMEIVLQNPIEELDSLRKEQVMSKEENTFLVESEAWDAVVTFADSEGEKQIRINEDLLFTFRNQTARLQFLNNTGEGRDCRSAFLYDLQEIRVIKDTSLVTLFINGGTHVFTTRYYPENVKSTKIKLIGNVKAARVFQMNGITVE